MDRIKIPEPEGKRVVRKKEGYTKDIIDSILRLDKNFYDADFCKFARATFQPNERGLRELWQFVKYKIKYKKDEDGISIQGTPLATWKLGTADCKNKTLFVNAVLRCIGVPYFIRFTNYQPGKKNVSHVYTVAILKGKQIPIDTVWNSFGTEKTYIKKIDKMTEIVEISGINEQPKVVYNKCYASFEVTESAKIVEEIKQRQRYVKQPEPILFSKLNEAQARIEVVKRQLQIIAVMNDEKSKIAKEGLELIYRAEKNNFCLTGVIPNELNKLASIIHNIKPLQQYSAIGWGILGANIRKAKRTNKDNSHSVEGFPERLCLNNQWYLTVPTSQTDLTPLFSYSQLPGGSANNGFCTGGTPYAMQNVLHSFFGTGMNAYGQNLTGKQYKDFTFLFYGRNTPYRVSFKEYGEEWRNTIIPKIISDGFGHGLNQNSSGLESVWFNNEMDYNAALDLVKESSGVFDKFINDIYSANATQNPDGTIGSGLLYGFSNEIRFNNASISLNSLPPVALSKMGFHNQFLDASSAYSGISRANILGLARNGVIFDTGKQPKETLDRLYSIYSTNSVNGHAIGDFGISAAIIAAIAAAVVTVIGAVAAAVEKCNKAETEANNIDSSLADTSRLSALGASLMPEQNDFMPLASNFGTGGGSGSGNHNFPGYNNTNNNTNTDSNNTAKIAAGVALVGGIYLYNKRKKSK